MNVTSGSTMHMVSFSLQTDLLTIGGYSFNKLAILTRSSLTDEFSMDFVHTTIPLLSYCRDQPSSRSASCLKSSKSSSVAGLGTVPRFVSASAMLILAQSEAHWVIRANGLGEAWLQYARTVVYKSEIEQIEKLLYLFR